MNRFRRIIGISALTMSFVAVVLALATTRRASPSLINEIQLTASSFPFKLAHVPASNDLLVGVGYTEDQSGEFRNAAVVDLATDLVASYEYLGEEPSVPSYLVECTSYGSHLFVTNSEDDQFFIYSLPNYTLLDSVSVGAPPHSISVDVFAGGNVVLSCVSMTDAVFTLYDVTAGAVLYQQQLPVTQTQFPRSLCGVPSLSKLYILVVDDQEQGSGKVVKAALTFDPFWVDIADTSLSCHYPLMAMYSDQTDDVVIMDTALQEAIVVNSATDSEITRYETGPNVRSAHITANGSELVFVQSPDPDSQLDISSVVEVLDLATGQSDELELPNTTCMYSALLPSSGLLVLTSELSGEELCVALQTMLVMSQEDAGVGPQDVVLIGGAQQYAYVAVVESGSVRKFQVP